MHSGDLIHFSFFIRGEAFLATSLIFAKCLSNVLYLFFKCKQLCPLPIISIVGCFARHTGRSKNAHQTPVSNASNFSEVIADVFGGCELHKHRKFAQN